MNPDEYAYQSSGSSDDEDDTYMRQQNMANQSESGDLLNEAQINSKPMSVLDELESFWEKTDANRGKKGILAEHIMESQAHELMNGGEAKGKGAFCM